MPKLDNKLKLFISYSHKDEDYIDEFITHLAPLKNNGLIEEWYDRKLLSGQDFDAEIDNNLEDADIICLCISANFLSSDACLSEKSNALNLKNKKGAVVVPIILSACGWHDDNDISPKLALPTDGEAISEFADKNKGWNNVYEGLKPTINREISNRKLKVSEYFQKFLQDTDLLSKAHSQKNTITLDDIFVYPDLSQYDKHREYEKKINSKEVVDLIYSYPRLLIAGENQSGKTTLCKKIFVELRKKNYIPIYLFDKSSLFHGKMENRISNALKEQYGIKDATTLDKNKFAIIIDDFHFAKEKEKHIQTLKDYKQIICIVDDIFSLNFSNDAILKSFTYFKIDEFSPSLRNELIKKWTNLTDSNVSQICQNSTYQQIDNSTELVNVTLGKMFGNGIMPAHPFFILSVISTYEAFSTPLDQEITSQGYCYQALIYLYLRKQNVKNDEVDTYINFLTEFAFYTYSENKNELTPDVFDSFMKLYLEKFNLPIDQDVLLDKLHQSQIIQRDSLGNHYFCYKYIYYFFVAKHIAENIEDQKETIESILSNLHRDKNAYIAIFISHHSKSNYIIDEILFNAMCLFDKNESATLSQEELHFFDKQKNLIIKAILPPSDSTPEIERDKQLKTQDVVEQKQNGLHQDDDDDDYEDILDDFAINLRRSIKTVEVMGRIIKNRAGSLEKSKLELIFKEAMRVHLRILSQFFELIEHKDAQKMIIDFIENSLNSVIEKKSKERKKAGKAERQFKKDALEKLSKKIFWNLNFFVIYGLINKIVHSLGSHKLTNIIESVCDDEATPASFLVKHGVLMWYNKNLQIEGISTEINSPDFSSIARKIMELQMVNFCSMHNVDYKDKQRISNKFDIPSLQLTKRIPGVYE